MFKNLAFIVFMFFLMPLGNAFAGNIYYGGSIGMSYSEPALEGRVDDLTENEFGRVKGAENTIVDPIGFYGKVFCGKETGMGFNNLKSFGELGYSFIGTWNMESEEGNLKAQKNVQALYGALGLDYKNWKFYIGLHQNYVEIDAKQPTKQNKRNKERYEGKSFGQLYGIRYTFKSNYFVNAEVWNNIGYEQNTGNSVVGAVSFGIVFN